MILEREKEKNSEAWESECSQTFNSNIEIKRQWSITFKITKDNFFQYTELSVGV